MTPPKSAGKRSNTPSNTIELKNICGANDSTMKSRTRIFSPPPSRSVGRGCRCSRTARATRGCGPDVQHERHTGIAQRFPDRVEIRVSGRALAGRVAGIQNAPQPMRMPAGSRSRRDPDRRVRPGPLRSGACRLGRTRPWLDCGRARRHNGRPGRRASDIGCPKRSKTRAGGQSPNHRAPCCVRCPRTHRMPANPWDLRSRRARSWRS